MRGRMLGAVLLACLAQPVAAYDLIRFVDPSISVSQAGRAVAAAASTDHIYAVDDKKHSLHIYSSDGSLIKTVAGLAGPQGVAMGPDGNVYVANTRANRIQVLSPQGERLHTIGRKGSGPGALSKPRSVAVAPDGRVYVADTGNDRIQVFTAEGVFLFGFGQKGKEQGQINGPTRIAVTASDHIYVLDEGNDRLQKFNPDTSFAKAFKLHGQDFAIDAYGFLYMLDAKRGKVKELGPDGFVLGGFGASGKGRGQFKKPRGIAIAPDGTILVVDTGNKRIQRVRLENKLKINKLQHNLSTKLTVTGPSRSLNVKAPAIAGGSGELYAWIPGKPGRVQVYDAKGKAVRRWGPTEEPERIKVAGGMAVSKKFGVFVADYKLNKVANFSPKGEHKSNFGESKGLFASKKKEGRVNSPHGVVINEKGAVYVADTGNRRVDSFSPDGTYMFGFGPVVGPHEFSRPIDVAWDDTGFIYVLDAGLKKVFKCEPSGGFIKAWGGEGEGVDQFDEPAAIAFDGKSYVYVLDRGHRRVQVFDREGKWITNFFSEGEDDVSLDHPQDIVVMGDQLIITDPARGRIASFDIHPRLAPPVSVSTKAVEGFVRLKWDEIKDPWVQRYVVTRSSEPFGPFGQVGKTEKPAFRDSDVEAYKTYYYRVAVEADTGDLGPASLPAAVFIPGAFNQAPVEIATVTVGNIFSANYKYYLDRPLGKAVLVNNLNLPFKNVKVSFRLKDFMDFATEKVVPVVAAKQRVEVPLKATLNNKILEVSEDTPIQAEVTLTYYEKGKKQEVSQAFPLKVYSRNAITWENPQRIANYITPKDPPVLDLARAILREAGEGPKGVKYLNQNLVIAMRIWSALGSLGIKFLPSPNNPFAKMSEDPAFPVDYTQFPRETLRRRSGECDDLVTLLASMFEGATVRTALLDYPGHLALMLDTGSNDPLEIGIPEDRLIAHDGTLWLPLEATMIESSFESAVRKSHYAYKEMAEKGRATIIDPRAAWKNYEPATLPKSNEAVPTLEAFLADKRFSGSAEKYLKERYSFLKDHLKAREKKEGETPELMNRRGILDIQHGHAADAKKEFERALAVESDNSSALNNLGNLFYIEGEFSKAKEAYAKAAATDDADAGVWMNLLRTALKLGEKDVAKEYAQKALALDKSLAAAIETLQKK
jgi:DNA-binding beta-propeller fold protein YncE